MQQLHGTKRDSERQPITMGDNERNAATLSFQRYSEEQQAPIGDSEREPATMGDSERHVDTLCDQRDSERQPETIGDI